MSSHSINNASSFHNSPSSEIFHSAQIGTASRHSEVLEQPLQAIKGLGLGIEICGSWIWVSGADGSHEAKLREAKFTWSSKRGCWYFCPEDYQPSSASQKPNRALWPMQKIRDKYGSEAINNESHRMRSA